MHSSDIASVINVVNLYAAALDTQQWALFDQVFTPDAQTDFGGPAPWPDLASLKRDFAAIHAPFDATQHVTTNHQVVTDGDAAHCLSYVHGRFIRQVPDGGNMFESGGWYDDRLVRTAAGWRIRQRTCRMVWWRRRAAGAADHPRRAGGAAAAVFEGGGRGRADRLAWDDARPRLTRRNVAHLTL